jgi:hypothetical protein
LNHTPSSTLASISSMSLMRCEQPQPSYREAKHRMTDAMTADT